MPCFSGISIYNSHQGVNRVVPLLLLLFHFSEAFAAVNRSVVTWLEGNFSFASAVSACCCEHFSLFTVSILSLVAAFLASLRFILETFFSIEFLLTCCEYEFFSAFFACQGLVFVHFFFLTLKYGFFALCGPFSSLIKRCRVKPGRYFNSCLLW